MTRFIEAELAEMRRLHDEGLSYKAIADAIGCAKSTVENRIGPKCKRKSRARPYRVPRRPEPTPEEIRVACAEFQKERMAKLAAVEHPHDDLDRYEFAITRRMPGCHRMVR